VAADDPETAKPAEASRPPEAEHAPDAIPKDEPDGHGPPFPVVGASAGGLEAFTELLEGLSPEPGMAFLFVLHRGATHKSLLPEILRKVTRMPVQEVSEGMAVEPDHVYLVPPATNMALADGRLTLSPRPPGPGHNMPADHLFRSLADIQKSRAVGVILSGGGTDGSLGFQSIKAEGGITFAQDVKTAKQNSMPRAAIVDGHVDYVLRPRDIARQLERIARHPYARQELPAAEGASGPDAVGDIINLLRSRTNVDFTHYKQTTIRRRVLEAHGGRVELGDGPSPGDERDTRQFFQEVLPHLGHDVVALAGSGKELVERCRETTPDLVITDITMPDMDGFEAAEAVNRDREVPVVLVSAHQDESLLTRAGGRHIMAYLTKPVKPPDLAAAVSVAMARFAQYQASSREVGELRQALEDRKLIERAKGIVTRRTHVDEPEAFRRMRKLSSDRNVKLVQVARNVLEAEQIFADLERLQI
jgi:chemotaxis response regulator CheB